MATRLKTHSFRGKRYDITLTGEVDGLCVQPASKRGEIILRTDLAPRVFLETAIHEAMHALNWAIPEAVVEERARELSRWLWRLGYRRTDE